VRPAVRVNRKFRRSNAFVVSLHPLSLSLRVTRFPTPLRSRYAASVVFTIFSHACGSLCLSLDLALRSLSASLTPAAATALPLAVEHVQWRYDISLHTLFFSVVFLLCSPHTVPYRNEPVRHIVTSVVVVPSFTFA